VNIGYFPNVTHAPGLVADATGLLSRRLEEVKATPAVKSFNAGPDVIQAILSGSLDISYIGPNPTINAYVQSKGAGVRVIAGSTSGGASLIVRAGISGAADLKGKKLATPQLGNTQDVAANATVGITFEPAPQARSLPTPGRRTRRPAASASTVWRSPLRRPVPRAR